MTLRAPAPGFQKRVTGVWVTVAWPPLFGRRKHTHGWQRTHVFTTRYDHGWIGHTSCDRKKRMQHIEKKRDRPQKKTHQTNNKNMYHGNMTGRLDAFLPGYRLLTTPFPLLRHRRCFLPVDDDNFTTHRPGWTRQKTGVRSRLALFFFSAQHSELGSGSRVGRPEGKGDAGQARGCVVGPTFLIGLLKKFCLLFSFFFFRIWNSGWHRRAGMPGKSWRWSPLLQCTLSFSGLLLYLLCRVGFS